MAARIVHLVSRRIEPATLPLFVAGLAGLGLTVAACGGSSASPSVANVGTTTAPRTSPSKAPTSASGGPAVAFAACIRTHGYPSLPPSTPGNPIPVADPNAPAFLKAERRCARIMPGNAPPVYDRPAEKLGPMLAFAACVRAHGVPGLPDPSDHGTFPKGTFPNRVDPGSPQFRSAAKTCAPLLHGEAIDGAPGPDGKVEISAPPGG